MPRLSARDLITIAALTGMVVAVGIATIFGMRDWALILIAALVAILGVILRLEFAARRLDNQLQRRLARELPRAIRDVGRKVDGVKRGVDDAKRKVDATKSDIVKVRAVQERLQSDSVHEQLAQDLSALRSEVRGMRVAQQLLSQTITSTKDDVRSLVAFLTNADVSSKAVAEVSNADMTAAIARIDGHTRYLMTDLLNEGQALIQLLARHNPTAPLPLLAGWALGPAGLVYLLDLIDRKNAQHVVECGSGTSTLWMALAMKAKGSGTVLALEHSEEYAEKTRAMLEAHGVADWAQVALCPLTTVETPRGDFEWYDLSQAVIFDEIDLLLVDGPPGATGRWARYPALPVLGTSLREDATVIVDDANRADENEMIEFWCEEQLATNLNVSPGHGIKVLKFDSNG